jgi:hypothetical protein
VFVPGKPLQLEFVVIAAVVGCDPISSPEKNGKLLILGALEDLK